MPRARVGTSRQAEGERMPGGACSSCPSPPLKESAFSRWSAAAAANSDFDYAVSCALGNNFLITKKQSRQHSSTA